VGGCSTTAFTRGDSRPSFGDPMPRVVAYRAGVLAAGSSAYRAASAGARRAGPLSA
jgi:hypothetical protein